MMCAIVGLLLVVNRQFAGMLEEMFLFFFPLPMVFYGAKYGMKTMDMALADLYKQRKITKETALQYAVDKEVLKRMMIM